MKTAAFPPKAGTRLLIAFMVIGATWFTASAQNPQVTVRFANPSYSCSTNTYCVDVEFSSDTPDEQLFGMNVRFFFEDTLLNFIGFSNYAPGYGPVSPDPPQQVVGMNAGMTFFQFSGSAVFVNGAVQLLDPMQPPSLLDTSWTQLFSVCFEVVDSTVNIDNFCPALVWDLEVDPANGGYLVGDDGVVITLVDPDPDVDSRPAEERVDQFNWMYTGDGTAPFGEIIEEVCISINCAPVIMCAADITIECDDDTSPLVTGSASADDICEGDTTITYTDTIIGGVCPNTFTIERTWIATNPCGLADTCIQTISIVDTTAPVIVTCPPPVTVSCASLVPAPNPALVIALDNCPGDIIYSFISDSISNVTCTNRYIITRTYAASDSCGNSSTCTQIITVNDITPPMIMCPANVTVSCLSQVPPINIGTVVASDNCGGTVTISYVSDNITNVICANRFTLTRVYRATDVCGNSATCLQVITVNDQTPPTLTCPAPVTVSCQNLVPAPNPASVIRSDNCTGAVTVTFVNDVISNQTCLNRYTITRTYRGVDVCGNEAFCTQLITVNDQTPPVITCPANVTIDCADNTLPPATGEPTVTDVCVGATSFTFSDVITNGSCPGNYIITRTFTGLDTCMNAATCVQTITVIDITGPTLVCPPDITIECTDDTSVDSLGNVVAFDACDTTVNITVLNTIISGDCPGNYTILRSFIGVDQCGNADTCVQTILVEDTTPPVLTCPADITIECTDSSASSETGEATAADACDTLVQFTELDVITPGICPGNYIITRSFIGVDQCGNADTCVQIITVEDTTPPMLICPADITIECTDDSSVAELGEATGTDACDTLVTITPFDVITPGDCPGNYTITRSFVGVDQCGNADTCIQIITVEDTTPPVLTCPAALTVSCDADLSVDSLGIAVAEDACDTLTTVTSFDEIIEGSCGGSYQITRSFIGTDQCGNADTCVQIITVEDTTPPQIVCPADITIECTEDTSVGNLGEATATDNCNAEVTILVSDEIVPGNCSGDYTILRSFIATDSCGNADTCIQTITVEDTTAPEIFCPDDLTIECSVDTSVFNLGGVSYTDACTTPATVSVFDEITPGDCPANYTITRRFIVEDECGNADTCYQTIVVEDTTAPIITCPDDVTVDCNGSFLPDSLGFATAEDLCSDFQITYFDIVPTCEEIGFVGDFDTANWEIIFDPSLNGYVDVMSDQEIMLVSVDLEIDSVDCENSFVLYQITIPQQVVLHFNWTFTSNDVDGPAYDPFGFMLNGNFVQLTDNSGPENQSGSYSILVNAGDVFAFAQLSTDCVLGTGATTVVEFSACPEIGSVTDSCSYTLFRQWVATDECGNASYCPQVITVTDMTPPSITCPADLTIACTDDTSTDSLGNATATDNCDIAIDIIAVDVVNDGSCPGEFTISRSWYARDNCGNVDSCVQTIVVQDILPPVLTCPPALTLSCTDDLSIDSIGIAAATDNCDTLVTITNSDVVIPGSCPGSFLLMRTFYGTDDCGNVDSCTVFYSVIDNEAPEITCPDDVTVNCTDNTSSDVLGIASGVDTCDTLVTITEFDIITPGDCPGNYIISRSFIAADQCGNADTCIQTITVIDTTGPVLTCPSDVTVECTDDTSEDSLGIAEAVDACDTTVTITVEETIIEGDCIGYYIIERTFIGTDQCGNSSTCVQIISVEDTTPPDIICPDDVTVECTDSLSTIFLGMADATDACDTLVDIIVIDSITAGSCVGNYTISRSFIASDQCGNADTCIQIITVQDTVGPVLTCPGDAEFSCANDVPEPDSTLVIATDNCGGDVEVRHLEDNYQYLCSNRFILARTYIGTDDCGNTSVCTQFFSVNDTIPPVLTCPADTIVTCVGDIPDVDTSLLIITDNCANGLVGVLDTSYITNQICAQQFDLVRVYSVNDFCGNISTCVQVISVRDTIAPMLICPADTSVVEFEDAIPDITGTPEFSDNCGEGVTIIFSDSLTAGACDGNVFIDRYWIAIDSCGNADTCVQSIVVLGDCNIDLALTKTMGVNPDTLRPGDDVVFVIEVENQGNVTISEVTVVDYIPVGLSLNDPNWTAGTAGSTGQSASIVMTVGNGLIPAGGLPGGQTVSVMLTLQINPDVTGGEYENLSEIEALRDQGGNDVSNADIDSDPDDDDTNDPVGEDDIDGVLFCVFVAPGLEGDFRVCSGEIETYTVSPSYPDHTYTFEFSEPVNILDSGDDFVTVEWTQDPGTTVFITVIDQDGTCTATDTFPVRILNAEPIACFDHLNFSIDNECGTMVLASVILVGEIPGDDFYEVYVIDSNGDTIPDAKLTYEHVGMTLMVKVVNACTGQSCWGWITVEDKLPPRLDCVCPVGNEDEECRVTCLMIDDFLQGNIPDEYRPRAIDNCGGTEIVLTNVELNYETCETGRIFVSWLATDQSGNQATCNQEIYIDPLKLETLVFPADFTGDCHTSDSPDTTGWPQILGLDITDVPNYCNIISTYRDDVVPVCGDGRKIFRRWRVLDWCNLEEREFTQIITLKDLEGPVVAPIGTLEYPASAHACNVDAIIPRPQATDECSSVESYTLFSPFGIITPIGGQYIAHDLPAGTHVFHWNISDVCQNVTTVYFEVTVRDISAPAMACQLHTVVGLTSNRIGGITTVAASSFDAGTADNCSNVRLRVRRMDSCIDVDWTSEGGCQDDVPDGFITGLDRGTEWADCVPFSCCDLGGPPVMVQVEATDESGNVNYCMVEVKVQDKFRPEITCPPTIVVSCDFLTELQTGTFTDENGDGSLDEDPLSAIFGNVYSALQHADSVRQPIVINDPANTDYSQPHVWGIDGIAYDNCSVSLRVTVSETIDCSGDNLPAGAPQNAVRLIMRVFNVSDGIHSASCSQRIWVVDNTPFYISDDSCADEDPNDGVIWPCDVVINECAGDMVEAGRPIIIEDGCSQIGVTYKDQRFDFAEGACYKILRTWTVIDWCQFGGKGQGQWQYTQEIKVADVAGAEFVSCPGEVLELCTTSPGVSLPDNNQVLLGENNPNASSCSAHVVLNQTVRETCSPSVRYDVKLFLFGSLDSVILKPTTLLDLDANHEGVMTFNTKLAADAAIALNGLPYTSSDCEGYHRIRWTVEDGCGNRSYCEYDLRLTDCKAPTPVCLNGISTVVMPVEGEVVVSASTFNASSVDDCTPANELVYSFSGNTYQPTFTYTCDNVPAFGEEIPVEIWVADQGRDVNCDGIITWDERNKAQCLTYIIITDPNDICDQEGGMLSGTIMTDQHDAVSTVAVNANSPETQLPVFVTTADGKFTFTNIEPEQEYSITPVRNDNPLNGVNTLDLVKIQKHLLGKEPFESVSNFIAADANKSGGITAIDMIEIRKLILGIYQEFPHNNSWRFVREGAVVGQGQTWSLEESVTVFPLAGEQITNLDFMGIKVGDVNNTAKANFNQATPRNNRDALVVNGAWMPQTSGAVVELKLILPKDIVGFQWTLEIDGLKFKGIRSRELPIDENHVGVLSDGIVTMSWNGEAQVGDGDDDVAIILEFEQTGPVDFMKAVRMTSRVTSAEAYDSDEETMDVRLEFPESGHASDFALYQNLPNPWKDQTLIPFDLPETGEAVLTIFDADGKVLHQVKDEFSEGANSVLIKTSDISGHGVLYYQLEANGLSATRKMLLLN